MFDSSRHKIERAYQHVEHIDELLAGFVGAPDFHTVSVDYDFDRGLAYLHFDFDRTRFPGIDIALVIGDALHNLRSALDLLWYEIVSEPSKWTRFPIRETRDELEAPLANALKQKQITLTIRDFLLDTIKPYQAGNYPLWALDELNIIDKHQLLIPELQLVRFDDVRLEDEQGVPVLQTKFFIMDETSRLRLDRMNVRTPMNRKITVKDKGHATATILFDVGIPCEGQAVVPSLYGIGEEVTRTLEAFEVLLLDG